MEKLLKCLPKSLVESIAACNESLLELRLRAGKPMQLVYFNGDRFCGDPISVDTLRKIVLAMMENSYYMKEDELSKGFFTMTNGFRVGVCGTYFSTNGQLSGLRAIGSICVRIAREQKGCAEPLIRHIVHSDAVASALILSQPGMGKTTLLRDAARIISEMGYTVGIADERHELAACCDGVPTLDIGPRSDVADGCAKGQAVERLVRSMAPNVIVMDEIGNDSDIHALQEAAHRGISLLATAHAGSFSDAEHGEIGRLLREKIFDYLVLMGNTPGKILEIRVQKE